MDQELAAMKGYLEIKNGCPNWNYDRDDDDENSSSVALMQRVI